jgi:hypothetical protein
VRSQVREDVEQQLLRQRVHLPLYC